jgi:hypothetical protein
MVKKTKKTTKSEETIKVTGENLLKTVKDLIAQGNVRHITIKDKEEKVIIEFPLTIGVVGVVFLPVLAAVGAIAALIGECTISVQRSGNKL